jgi:hypothetical protein
MKRDMDLVREILLEMETWNVDQRDREIVIKGHTPEEITYHLGLMHQAGLIKAADASSRDGEAWLPVDILWDGHEFLEASRNETIWAKAKQKALTTTGTLTLEALKVALSLLIKQAVMAGF